MGSTVVKLNPLLRMATIAGVETAVKLHIARGDDLDAQDGGGATPLMLAAMRKKTGVLRLLLAAGANPALLDSKGRNALIHAEEGGCPECVALLREALDAHLQENKNGRSFEGLPFRANEPNPTNAITSDASLASPSDRPGYEDAGWAAIQVEESAALDERPFYGSSIPKEESCPNGVGLVAVEPLLVVEAEAPSNVIYLDDEPLDSGFEDDWMAESEAIAPKGNETVSQGVSALQEVIGRHKAFDTDEAWDDVDLFLPERALPLARDDGEGIRGLLFRALREGSVPEAALIEVCREAEGSCNEDAERLLTFVLGDLGVVIAEWEELGEGQLLGEPTIEEEQILAEAMEFTEDLASGRNDPLRYYVKGFKGDLLDAKEEIALGQAMEAAGSEALDALAHWPTGLSAVFEAANRVALGEADPETFSSGPEPCEEDEANAKDTSSEDEEVELDPNAAAFVSAITEARLAGNELVRVRAALVAACLSRGFLLELARTAGSDIAGAAFASAVRRQAASRERMIVSNLRLVFSIARKYLWSGVPLDDLVQEGNIGLIKAVERFDWRKGFRFSTYAMWWIREQISRGIANKAKTIRVPVHVQKLAWRIVRERTQFEVRTGHLETEIEISIRTGISIDKIRLLLAVFEDVASLDEPDQDSGLPLLETLLESKSSDPALTVEVASLRVILLGMIGELDKRAAEVILLRFGLEGVEAMSLEEVGRRFDVTRERIRQIESEALKKFSTLARKVRLALYMGDQFEPKQSPAPSVQLEDSPTSREKKATKGRERALRLNDSLKGVSQPEKPTSSVKEAEAVSARQYDLLSGLLEEARNLGLCVEDARSRGGKVLVSLPVHPDVETHKIARKMRAVGFTLLCGTTYVK